MIAKNTELFGNVKEREANIPDGHTGVTEITVKDGEIQCQCSFNDSGPECNGEKIIRNHFDGVKEKFPSLCLEGDFYLNDHNWGLCSDEGCTETDMWDSDYVEPEYCRICGGEVHGAYWSDWTATVCVCSPEAPAMQQSITSSQAMTEACSSGTAESMSALTEAYEALCRMYSYRICRNTPTKDNVIPLLNALDSKRTGAKIRSGDLKRKDVSAAREILLDYADKLGIPAIPDGIARPRILNNVTLISCCKKMQLLIYLFIILKMQIAVRTKNI